MKEARRSLSCVMVIAGVCAVSLAGVLIGCSGEPSEADLEKAVKVIAKAELEKTQALMKQLESDPLMKSLTKGSTANRNLDLDDELGKISVKKLACAKAEGNPGYNCDVEMSRLGEGGAGPQKSPMKGRFVKSDDGWVMMMGPLGR
ncbi:MAG: hypothetical protein RI101_03940 [Nitrospira sp.]|jgi:hypothetical protein|nr:hypothetical protein [Nitrospira sp.]